MVVIVPTYYFPIVIIPTLFQHLLRSVTSIPVMRKSNSQVYLLLNSK